MIEYKTILDKVKEEYIQIPLERFEKIKKFLREYWGLIKINLKIENKEEVNIESNLIELLNYFDPKRTPATRLNLIENLPPLEDIIQQNFEIENDLIKMQKLFVLFKINRINNSYLVLSPEGLIFLLALEKSKKYDNYYRLNTLIIDNYQKLLFIKFREFIFEKFENLQIVKKETPAFTKKDIAILLFFLINGSISKKNAFKRDERGSEKALNCIVQAFHKNLILSEEDRDDEKVVPIRVLQSDLSVLQKTIGYAINIEQGKYFIKPSEVLFIKTQLKKFFKEKIDIKQDFISRWNSFKKEYNHWRPLLRENKICYYDYQVLEDFEVYINNLQN